MRPMAFIPAPTVSVDTVDAHHTPDGAFVQVAQGVSPLVAPGTVRVQLTIDAPKALTARLLGGVEYVASLLRRDDDVPTVTLRAEVLSEVAPPPLQVYHVALERVVTTKGSIYVMAASEQAARRHAEQMLDAGEWPESELETETDDSLELEDRSDLPETAEVIDSGEWFTADRTADDARAATERFYEIQLAARRMAEPLTSE